MPFGERLSTSWVVGFEGVQVTLENPFSSTVSSLQRQHFKVEKAMRFMQTIRNYLAKQNELADASVEEIKENRLPSQPIALVMACFDGRLLREGAARPAAAC